MTEYELVDKYVDTLKAKGYEVATEVSNLYRSADVAFINSNDEVVIVEAKLSSVGHAIKQASTHLLAADLVYILTPKKSHRKKFLSGLKEKGIGLLHYKDNKFIEVVTPRHNKTWYIVRRKVVAQIKEGDAWKNM